MASKIAGLLKWCKAQCEGYNNVSITNFTSSWKSGLAFCAIIHRYRPDLINYDSLSPKDTYGNSKLAFDVALSLGIPALLDPEDMVQMTVPDKLCIITYVSQYYNYFHNKHRDGGPSVRVATKRPPSHLCADLPPSEKRLTPTRKDLQVGKKGTLDDKCLHCKKKVYLLERHIKDGQLYHRLCFRESDRVSSLQRNKGTEQLLAASRHLESSSSSELRKSILEKERELRSSTPKCNSSGEKHPAEIKVDEKANLLQTTGAHFNQKQIQNCPESINSMTSSNKVILPSKVITTLSNLTSKFENKPSTPAMGMTATSVPSSSIDKFSRKVSLPNYQPSIQTLSIKPSQCLLSSETTKTQPSSPKHVKTDLEKHPQIKTNLPILGNKLNEPIKETNKIIGTPVDEKTIDIGVPVSDNHNIAPTHAKSTSFISKAKESFFNQADEKAEDIQKQTKEFNHEGGDLKRFLNQPDLHNWKNSAKTGVFQENISSDKIAKIVAARSNEVNQKKLFLPKFWSYSNVVKRKVSAEEPLSEMEISSSLRKLDLKLKEVEKEGRRLEEVIRSRSEENMEEEEIMKNWLTLVKERSQLIREESELIYQRQQQILEKHHEELEYQFRFLSNIPENEKTSVEKKLEEQILQEIMKIVASRNMIVDSIETDRIRYKEEDELYTKSLTNQNTALKKSKKPKINLSQKFKNSFQIKGKHLPAQT